MARIVGLDLGARRIGVAVSDATGTLARPVGALRVAGLGPAALAAVATEIGRLEAGDDPVVAVVVGLPLRLDGSPNTMTGRAETFARALRIRIGRDVILQDERLSSQEAESRLAMRERDWRVRKGRVDAAAAAVILQDYLDHARPASAADLESDSIS